MIATTDPPRVFTAPNPPRQVHNSSLDNLRTGGALALGDLLGISAGLGLAAWLVPPGPGSLAVLAAIAANHLLVFTLLGLYPATGLHPAWEFRKIVSATLVTFAPFMVLAMLPGIGLPAGTIALAFALALLTQPLSRVVTRRLCSRAPWWGCRVAVFGDRRSVATLSRKLTANPRQGLRPVIAVALSDLAQLDLSDLPRADRALVLLGGFAPESERAVVIARLEAHFNEVTVLDPMLSVVTGEIWGEMRNHVGISGVSFRNNLSRPVPRGIKRGMDIALSAGLILALLPVFGLIALLIAFGSPGRLIYTHERIGKNGRRFRAWKFRTMVSDADTGLSEYLNKHPGLAEQWRANQKLERDPRVTPIGRFLRKSSLDELPQLWNVLVGEMSLVGPRPIVMNECARYAGTLEKYLRVTPGITGLWQVSGRNNTTYSERVSMDDFYVRNWSPWLDAYVMFRTVRTVLTAEGAS